MLFSFKSEKHTNCFDRYDRDFVLQFRDYCMERPLRMEEHEVITPAQPIEQSVPTATRTRRRRSVRSNAEPVVPTPILTGSTLVVPVTASLPSASLTAEEQLLVGTISASPSSATSGPLSPGMGRTGSRGGRSRNGSNAAKMGGLNATTSTVTSLHPFPMMRSKSHGSSRPNALGSAHPPPPLERRSGSQKAQKRSASIRNDPPLPFSSLAPGLTEEYKPLETSANRWTPSSLGVIKPIHSAPDATVESEEVVEKRLKGLLNKLTLEKFDSISDQIVSWANKSERETDGATLRLVIRLVFDKATDEAAWSAMYARLCRKMMEQVSTEVRDENIHDRKGEPIVGGQLFRQYLLSRCQADFERGWSTRETLEEQQSAAAAAAAQESAPGEMVFSDEYYALQKAKRRGLGLVKFIGELFKLGMLTERIMHRCILKLLDEPAEDDIESVCQLLKTVGAALSRSKGKESMDMYFERMRELSESANISQRIRFMLLVSLVYDWVFLPDRLSM
jgi:translation initiation factor 4G